MKYLKTFICASLLICSFSCYGQYISSSSEIKEQEFFVIEEDTITLTSTNLSDLLALGKIEKVIKILKTKPILASSLTSEQVETIGVANWIIIKESAFTLLPEDIAPNEEAWTTINLEINAWLAKKDESIIVKLVEDKLQIALISELESDWYNWIESQSELSQKEKEIFKENIENKIRQLSNQSDKKAVIKLFKNAGLKISITQK